MRDADRQQFTVRRRRDAGAEPQVAPDDPAWPQGRDVDISACAPTSCRLALRCPARRIGRYIITCRLCGVRVGVSAAGRADDPRSIAMACRLV